LISKSMILLTDSINNVYNYSEFVPDLAIELIKITSSPLTIIYPCGKNVAPELLAQDGSIGIRVTNDPFLKTLLSGFKKPVVATSANISNEKAPINYEEIDIRIIKSVDYIVKYRQSNTSPHKPSGIIKFFISGEFKILRK
jgi:L-threonylcarbamoyladenylate synthase